MENDKRIIDISKVFRHLKTKKKTFLKVWVITFILSCVWIFPQPRFYICDVKLAPESSEDEIGGGISSLASSFGFNLGGGGNDAIYPTLYPELFQSPEFLVGLFDIQVTTIDGKVSTDYYTYLTKHQKQNILTLPFEKAKYWLSNLFSSKQNTPEENGRKHDPFRLTETEYNIMLKVKSNIKCQVDRKTDVISISVKDQDPYICAILADSLMERLQNFIIDYRTQKARLDLDYCQKLADSTEVEYHKALADYSEYCDKHKDALLQTSLSERDRLENELSIKMNAYQAMMGQLQAMKAKVQEKTPAFTTLQSSTVPIKPAGPKRMLFIIGMMILATLATVVRLSLKESRKQSTEQNEDVIV